MRRIWIAALLLALLGGCVTERDLQVQREMMEMNRRLDHMERTLKAVQEETSGGVKVRFDALTRAQAEQQAALDSLRVDVQGVQGRFDDFGRADAALRQEMTLLKDEHGLQIADLGQRLAKLEPASTPPGETADGLYDKALQAIRDRQEYATGREQMTTFLQRYPTDPRAVNAAYWIGETLYAEKAFDKAVLQFEEVAQKYGADPKVASALYKQALAFDALKDRKSARVVLKKVVERFPLSEEAKKAKDKLKEWGP